MSSSKPSFLALPVEIRLQIYNHALQPTRLSTRPILDPEYLFTPGRHKSNPTTTTVPALLYASKQINTEATPMFYTRATLAITPTQHSPDDLRTPHEFFAQHDSDHSFCPARHLKLISTVHVFSEQSWVVDEGSLQAVFRWVVARTGVREVYLSRKTMQQGRHVGEMVSLEGLAWMWDGPDRVVDVYARNVSSRLRCWGSALTSRVKPLPDVLVYYGGVDGVAGGLCREEECELGGVDEEVQKREMERFAKEDLGDAYLRQAHADGYLWLFKTIQIRRKNSPPEQEAETAILSVQTPILVF